MAKRTGTRTSLPFKLKEKVRDMERASSEQQAKILMSAFTEAKSGAGLGGPSTSLLSTQSAGTGD